MAFIPAKFMFEDQDFHGVSPLLMRRSMSFSAVERCEEVHGDDMSDDGSPVLGEKKKRLNMDQVKELEKSYELGNKLEPERKLQLARALGLEQRQVAIWFQNRRARSKTKQLEKDYVLLKRQYEQLKAENDALQVQNRKLHVELLVLKDTEWTESGPTNLNKETKGFWNNGRDVNSGATRTPEEDSPLYSHPDNKHMFPSPVNSTSVTQLLPTTRSDPQSHKIDQTVPEEKFCNMFSDLDNRPGFWPWSEQAQFH